MVGDQIPVETTFCTPVQTSLLYNGYQVSFPGVKQPERGINHPAPSSVKVEEKVELYLYSLSGPSWPVLGWALPLQPCNKSNWNNATYLMCLYCMNVDLWYSCVCEWVHHRAISEGCSKCSKSLSLSPLIHHLAHHTKRIKMETGPCNSIIFPATVKYTQYKI
jgi:hypothetical protein